MTPTIPHRALLLRKEQVWLRARRHAPNALRRRRRRRKRKRRRRRGDAARAACRSPLGQRRRLRFSADRGTGRPRRRAREGVQRPCRAAFEPRRRAATGGARRQGGTPRRARRAAALPRSVAGDGRCGQRDDRRPRPPDDRDRTRDRRCRGRRPVADDGPEDRGPALARRVPPHRHDRQRDGQPALIVRRRGHARRARGRHGGQARRPGEGEGHVGRLEGPHRQRQPDGVEPDRAGSRHRAGYDRGRERRPLEEDQRRRQGRDPRAQEHHQHDGRPALLVRRRGDARRTRGRHRGQARRPGAASRASAAPGKTSPTTSTSWRRT